MQTLYSSILAFLVSLILSLMVGAAEEKKVEEKKEETPKIQVIPGFADKITITGFVQLQYTTSTVDDAVSNSFEIRRARIGAIANFNDWITGRFELDGAPNKDGTQPGILRDAFLNVGFEPGFQLKLGQYKKPFSVVQLIADTAYPTVERGIRLQGVGQKALDNLLQALRYNERDIGITVLGSFKDLLGKGTNISYQVGVFNGEGLNKFDINNGKQIVGRVVVTPLKGLDLAADFVNNTLNGDPIRDSSGNAVDSTNVQAFGFDVQYRPNSEQGLWLIGEVDFGDNFDNPSGGFLRGDKTATFVGFTTVVAYRIPVQNTKRLVAFEPVFRVDFTDPNREVGDDGATLITPAFNLYFQKNVRLMFDYDIVKPQDSHKETESGFLFRAQVIY
ncbi:MAG TPA: porin [Candidatus Limnocylindrales bacterium]|nr:porin [Candidatus Limnocylindrales bacterium]